MGEVAFDGRDSVDHTERHRRGRRARRSPPRPEGQARRQDQQRTCAGEDRGAHPLVQALVRDGGVGQRVDPLCDAVDQLAPCVRDEESRAHARGFEHEADGDQRGGGAAAVAQPRVGHVGERQHHRAERRRDDRHQRCTAAPRRIEQVRAPGRGHERAEQGERREPDQAGPRRGGEPWRRSGRGDPWRGGRGHQATTLDVWGARAPESS